MKPTASTGKADLTRCDREAIHNLGCIQDVGFAFVCTTDWLVTQVSENIDRFMSESAGDIIGRPARDLLCHTAIQNISNIMQWLEPGGRPERVLEVDLLCDGRLFDLSVHLVDGEIFVEAMPSEDVSIADPIRFVRAMMATVNKETDKRPFFQRASEQLQAVSGFDRVMAYEFHADGSGEVIAEAREDHVDSFMGHRFPAGDVPKQARELYKRNPFRLIADVDAKPVPMHPRNRANGRPLDMSMSTLRSVSEVHIEYLRNMGVGASFSVSILVGGELWGMFVCHHSGARNIPMGLRMTAELFSELFSLEVEARESRARVEQEETSRRFKHSLMAAVSIEDDLFAAVSERLSQIAALIDADACAIYLDEQHACTGKMVSPRAVKVIAGFLDRTNPSEVFHTNELRLVLPGAAEFCPELAGLLAIPVSRNARDYLMFFRRELVQNVSWGGNPNKIVTSDDDGRLRPRTSFSTWQEEVRGRSQDWSSRDLAMADSIRVALLEIVVRTIQKDQDDKARERHHKDLLIAELNHRIKNVFALFRGIVGETSTEDLGLDEFKDVLAGRITSLAAAHELVVKSRNKSASLRQLLSRQMASILSSDASRLHLKGPTVSVDSEAVTTIALVLHELMTNAMKYGALSTPGGRVTVNWSLSESSGDLLLTWIEVGGPEISEPTATGFGSTILEQAIPHELGGDAKLEYRPTGLVAAFSVPAACIVEPGDEDEVDESDQPPSHTAFSGTVLVVEDNLMIAMSTKAMLQDLGFGTIHLASSIEDAMRKLDTTEIDLALLDVSLGRQTSMPIARALKAIDTPFLFCTGYGDLGELSADFRSDKVVSKPFTSETLKAAINAVLPDDDSRK